MAYDLEFNTSVTIDCNVIGKSAPTVEWLKDGEVIMSDDHYEFSMNTSLAEKTTNSTLTISNVLHTDTDIYTCRAEAAGVAEYDFMINVFGKARLLCQINTIELKLPNNKCLYI